MSPLDNACTSAQGRHIFPLKFTLDQNSLIKRLSVVWLLMLQFSIPHAFLQVPQVFQAWLTRLPQFLIHLLPILMRERKRWQREIHVFESLWSDIVDELDVADVLYVLGATNVGRRGRRCCTGRTGRRVMSLCGTLRRRGLRVVAAITVPVNDKSLRASKPTCHWFVIWSIISLPFCFFRNPIR